MQATTVVQPCKQDPDSMYFHNKMKANKNHENKR